MAADDVRPRGDIFVIAILTSSIEGIRRRERGRQSDVERYLGILSNIDTS